MKFSSVVPALLIYIPLPICGACRFGLLVTRLKLFPVILQPLVPLLKSPLGTIFCARAKLKAKAVTIVIKSSFVFMM